MWAEKKWVKIVLLAVAAVACACVLFFTGQGLSESEKHEELKKGRFARGIFVNNIALSGMTLEEAQDALKPVEQELYNDTVFTLLLGQKQYTLNADELNISFDTDTLLNELMLLGKGGSIYSRLSFGSEPAGFFITKTVNGVKDSSVIDAICEEFTVSAQNAAMSFTPNGEKKFTYTEATEGITIDRATLEEQLTAALKKGDIVMNVPYTSSGAEVTGDALRNITTRRSYYETSYADAPYNDEDRVYNIKKCVSIINSKKITLAPGESMSLNSILGDRTEAAGWRLAGGYVSGRTEEQAGGGVCQISSTLYIAAIKADLKVTERTNHSIPVGYMPMGLDATISTGGPDLVIKNTTGNTVYICCGLSGEQSVYFEIYGEAFTGFTGIGVTSELVRETEPEGETIYTYTDELPSGEEEVYIKRRSGYEYTAYKTYYNGDTAIKTEELYPSTYKAFAGEIKVGR